MTGAGLRHAYWLASRGAQQMDLALRFAAETSARGLDVMALKGISVADALYGGVHHRPMADIDFLVVDRTRFEAAAEIARSLGLVEIFGSDHALAFKESASGVVLELHISLTSCPGLFAADHQALWERRAVVAGGGMSRLGDADLAVHLALHTAFQHGFVANEFHLRDFVRVIEVFKPSTESVLARAREWGAIRALGAMAVACRRQAGASPEVMEWLNAVEPHCPRSVRVYLQAQRLLPPPMNLVTLARVRYVLAPSARVFVWKSLLPAALPGRTAPRPGALRRFVSLVKAGFPSPLVSRS
jgi:hypothetical protein